MKEREETDRLTSLVYIGAYALQILTLCSLTVYLACKEDKNFREERERCITQGIVDEQGNGINLELDRGCERFTKINKSYFGGNSGSK